MTEKILEENQTSEIIISGSLKEVREEINDIPKGKYLYIETNLKGKPIYIPFTEFSSRVSQAKTRPKTNIPSGGSQVGTESDTLVEKVGQKPDFRELMAFLLRSINVNFESCGNKMFILSDVGTFLELPWEDIVDEKDIYVFRKVPNDKEISETNSENNILFLLSHAHENIGDDLKKKMDEETKEIFDLVLENEQQSFRIERALLSKHTTKQSLESINWEEYNYAHFIMHGLSDGRLCLEKQEKTEYKKPDFMSVSEFLDILKEKNLNLIFLSFCFSGGGLDEDKESLAPRLIKNSCSKYAIGYSYPVREPSAALFAKNFYGYLINGYKIERVYELSLEKYYQQRGIREYIPFLYMRK